MRALLDVNVLIALLDANHQFHATARAWFVANAAAGWASCPITQNGAVRILSQPAYPNAISPAAAIERLRNATTQPQHQFWPDDASLLDGNAIRSDRLHGPRQLTAAYLLALAVRHGGRLVSFDARATTAAVIGAGKRHLVVL